MGLWEEKRDPRVRAPSGESVRSTTHVRKPGALLRAEAPRAEGYPENNEWGLRKKISIDFQFPRADGSNGDPLGFWLSLRPNAQQSTIGANSPRRPDRLWGPSPNRAPKPPMAVSIGGALRTTEALIGPRLGSVGCSPAGGGARGRGDGNGGYVPC